MTTLTYAAQDSAAMLGRNIRHTLRSPDTLIMSAALPVMILLMFVYVFGGAMNVGTEYLNYVVPGVILLCAGFGASTTAVGVATDMSTGVIDRFRAMAIWRPAVLAGHVGVSLLRNLLSTSVVVAIAVLMGFRAHAGVLEWAGAVGIIALYVLALSWISVALGLVTRNPEAAGGFTFFIAFVPYISSAFVPVHTLPVWLRGLAKYQPVTPVIETVRGLLMGTAIGNNGWLASCWCVGLVLVGFGCSALLFRRATAH